uniref:Uncharacterized protein n=1 Tax=Otus sunia TaxID=257818 RepID=A0A8C8AH15_9STRI
PFPGRAALWLSPSEAGAPSQPAAPRGLGLWGRGNGAPSCWAALPAGSGVPTSPPQDWDSHGSAVAIQAWWWGQLVCWGLEVAPRSTCHIQAWWHRAVTRQPEEQRLRALVAYVRWDRASDLLQAHARTRQARDEDWHCQEAAHTIQARWHRCRECGRPASPPVGCSRPC